MLYIFVSMIISVAIKIIFLLESNQIKNVMFELYFYNLCAQYYNSNNFHICI